MSTTSETDSNALNVKLLLSTFLKIEPQADEFATTFYYILFNKYPKVRGLFAATDMAKQKAKLIESLQLVMVNVNNPSSLTLILKNLGKRHVQYGAVLTDYPLIGDALLQALEKHLGKDWTAEVKQTWTLAYQMIADTMAEGARTVSQGDPATTPIGNEPISTRDTDLPISKSDLPPLDSPNNGAIDRKSDGKSILPTLILLVSLGLMGICGYMVWNVTHSQPNSSPSTSVNQDK
jgi:hemoglobin-like flavoprotein